MSSKVSDEKSEVKHVVIAGAGVVGTTTAYYLAKDFGISSTLVDPTGTIAPAASGKAGGFLALDWNDYSPVGPLARRSFDLHQTLANELGADTLQYRRLTCAAISVGNNNRPKGKKLEGIEWVEGDDVEGMRPLGDESTIAQVHPKKLCEALWKETQKLTPDSQLVQGKIISARVDDKNPNQLVGALMVGTSSSSSEEEGDASKTTTTTTTTTKPTVISGDALLYACGPWTSNVMTGVKYHSVVVPTSTVLSQCVFFSGHGDPEVYVRPDQTAYCTGFPDAPIQVTEQPGQEQVRPDAVAKIQQAVQKAASNVMLFPSSKDNKGATTTITTASACYLPSTPDGLPLMGKLTTTSTPNTYIAAGHSCWGILMGPATGESMAHLIAKGTSPHVDLSVFDPSRMGNMQMVP